MGHGDLEVLSYCRALTSDGELSSQEVWLLADWLNTHPDSCDTWPGTELVPLLSRVFENGSVNVTELKQVASKLSAIERKAARLRRHESMAEAIEKFDPMECALPSIDHIVRVPSSSQPGEVYVVGLRNSSCTCPDWTGSRSMYPDLDLRRCCKHVAFALYQATDGYRWPGWLGALINDCRYRQRGTHPLEQWRVVNVRETAAAFGIGPSEWVNVWALWQGAYSRFGYNLQQERWSYGHRPYLSRTIVEAVKCAVRAG